MIEMGCWQWERMKYELTLGEDEIRMIWKEYFKDLHSIDTQEQVAVKMCTFDGARRSNYFGE